MINRSALDKPDCLIIRLLFGFASDAVFVKLAVYSGRHHWIPESRCMVGKGPPPENHLLRFFEQTPKVEAGGHPSVSGGMQVEEEEADTPLTHSV